MDPTILPDGSVRNCVKNVTDWPEELTHHGLTDFRDVTLFLNNSASWPNENTTAFPNVIYFTGDDRLLLKIVREVIFPTKNADNRVTYFHAMILVLLKLQIPIHLPRLLMDRMSEAPSYSLSHYLPYGGLVTHIVRKWGINIEGDELPQDPSVIGKATISRQQSIRVGSRIFQTWEREFMTEEDRVAYDAAVHEKERRKTRHRRGQAPPVAPVQNEPQAEEGNWDDMFEMPPDEAGPSVTTPQQAITARLDSLEQGQRRMEARQRRHSTRLSGMIQFLQALGHKTGTSTASIDNLPSSPEE